MAEVLPSERPFTETVEDFEVEDFEVEDFEDEESESEELDLLDPLDEEEPLPPPPWPPPPFLGNRMDSLSKELLESWSSVL